MENSEIIWVQHKETELVGKITKKTEKKYEITMEDKSVCFVENLEEYQEVDPILYLLQKTNEIKEEQSLQKIKHKFY